MVKRIVMADDVTGEFDGVVKDQLNTAIAEADSSQDFLAVRAALAEGAASVAVGLVGDSTANGLDEWAAEWCNAIALLYPGVTFQHRLWDSTGGGAWSSVNRVQTGSAGERYVNFPGVTSPNQSRQSASATLPAKLRVEAKVRFAASGTSQTICALFGAGGQRAFRFQTSVSHRLVFDWTTDGTTLQTAALGAGTLPVGSDIWVAVEFTPDNGSGNHSIAFFTSADGFTWTNDGAATVRSGTSSIWTGPGRIEIGARGGSAEPMNGRMYEIRVMDAATGGLIAPALPEHWDAVSAASTVEGASIFTLVNASHAGAGISYLSDSARRVRMTPNYGQIAVWLSTSHNEGPSASDTLMAAIDAWGDFAEARFPGAQFGIITQNPRISPADGIRAQAARRVRYLAFARRRGWTAYDTYQAFLDWPDGVADLLNVDGFHPNTLGSKVWARYMLTRTGYAADLIEV